MSQYLLTGIPQLTSEPSWVLQHTSQLLLIAMESFDIEM